MIAPGMPVIKDGLQRLTPIAWTLSTRQAGQTDKINPEAGSSIDCRQFAEHRYEKIKQ
jgi:hypothetical protein